MLPAVPLYPLPTQFHPSLEAGRACCVHCALCPHRLLWSWQLLHDILKGTQSKECGSVSKGPSLTFVSQCLGQEVIILRERGEKERLYCNIESKGNALQYPRPRLPLYAQICLKDKPRSISIPPRLEYPQNSSVKERLPVSLSLVRFYLYGTVLQLQSADGSIVGASIVWQGNVRPHTASCMYTTLYLRDIHGGTQGALQIE